MTFTSIPADRHSTLNSRSPSLNYFFKISAATSVLAALGLVFLQFLLWMPVSAPAELPTACHHARTAVK